MYVIDGIAYAGEQTKPIKVSGVRVLDDYKLWIRFTTGESKTFNFEKLLNSQVFSKLKDKSLFSQVYIDYGTLVWDDGNIDISPEKLYQDGVLVNNSNIA